MNTVGEHAYLAQRRPPLRLYFLVRCSCVKNDGHALRGPYADVNRLDMEVQPVDCRDGSSNIFVWNVNGATEHADITCKRGITEDRALGT